MKTYLIYTLAAAAEIAGCYAFWSWLKLGRSAMWIIAGTISLVLFAYLLTLVEASNAGRAYAAYGAIYIAASIAWLWLVEKQVPDWADLTGAAICLAGAVIIMFGRLALK
ncbi:MULTISPECIES: YnfA family protein [Asticcacaulis]|uniref:YnfA family protein n=1 Tax=Asticcacaulis TaxID=76890 RepID=UPI001AE626E7|nr:MULTISPECIES: YnfA family protein [Asticcacaulis]MBP2159096.1 small multidrug resistance family-3 protein [Asticcacaulis solisilvae]MDR6800141.1 small multidrug resistance family-3 protein [Asticcacaulis sp. BE141]